ncbi:MAG: beta-lactamase family protein [Gammaproteobacteria bacterium]|nr:beta-lactamase family protein [Gammaproteobacteria bacterium]MDH3467886.1 beta-lactamase family protein [Gammaproteobacteria bacterium]
MTSLAATIQPDIPRNAWDRAPWNRWAFQHVRELLPTVEVWRGADAVWPLPRHSTDLDEIEFYNGKNNATTVKQWLVDSYTDGFVVLHEGVIVYEKYMNGMTERTQHLSQSMAKSVTSCVAGILVGRGLLDPETLVTDYLPELSETAWDGALLRHVLDMTSGVQFDENYEALDSDIARTDVASGWKIAADDKPAPSCVWEQILGLVKLECAHGDRFRYRSIETDVLANCMERVTGWRLAELVGRELWAPLGCEESAYFTVDTAGYALADGGFNATLRDYARVGQMLLDGGVGNDRRIVPQEWLDDTLACDPSKFDQDYRAIFPNGAYRNQFWIEDYARRVIMARGVFGQLIYVDPHHDMVAVKLSSWPEFRSPPRAIECGAALHAIAAQLTNSYE